MTLLQEFALRFGLEIQGQRIYGFYGFISEHDGKLWMWTHSHSPNGHQFVSFKPRDEEAALAELGIESRVLVVPPPRPRPDLIHFVCGHSKWGGVMFENKLIEREDGSYDYPSLCLECFGETTDLNQLKATLERLLAKAASGR